jgi:hypothetical protein
MREQDAQIVEQRDEGRGRPVLLQGRTLWLARALWLAVCLLAVALFLAGLPGRWMLAAIEAADQPAARPVRANDWRLCDDKGCGAHCPGGRFEHGRTRDLPARAREPMALFVAIMLVAPGRSATATPCAAAGRLCNTS